MEAVEKKKSRYNRMTDEQKKKRIAQTLPLAKARYNNMTDDQKKEYSKRQNETRKIRIALKKAEKKRIQDENDKILREEKLIEEVKQLKIENEILLKENKALNKTLYKALKKALKKELE